MSKGICQEESCGFMLTQDLGEKVALKPGVVMHIPGDGERYRCSHGGNCPHAANLIAVFNSIPDGTLLLSEQTMRLSSNRLATLLKQGIGKLLG